MFIFCCFDYAHLLMLTLLNAGSLHEILDMVRILLSIWNRGRRQPENFSSTEVGTSAPLVPVLRR